MVTVVQKPLSGHARHLSAVGRGLSGAQKAIQPLVEMKYQQNLQRDQQMYERDLLQTALNDAQKVFNDSSASPADKLFAYKSAMAGLGGGGDRSEANFVNQLLTMGQAQAGARENAAEMGLSGDENFVKPNDPLTQQLMDQQERRAIGNENTYKTIREQQNRKKHGGAQISNRPSGRQSAPMGIAKQEIQQGDEQPQARQYQQPQFSQMLDGVPGGMQGRRPTNVHEQIQKGAGFDGPRSNIPESEQEFSGKLIPAETINRVANQERQEGKLTLPRTTELQEHNQRIEEQKQRQLDRAASETNLSRANQEQQKEWRTFAETQAKNMGIDISSGENAQIFNEIVSKPFIAKESDYSKRFHAAADVFNQFKALENSIVQMNQRVNFDKREYELNEKSIKLSIKPMLDLGLYGPTERMLASMGYGRLEAARFTNDLNDNTKSLISKGPNYQEINNQENTILANTEYMTREMMDKAFTGTMQQRAELNNQWKEIIRESINDRPNKLTRGLSLVPGTNLLLIRDGFLKAGGRVVDFMDIINDLGSKNEISLDWSQTAQIPLLSKNPRETLGLWQNFLNIFPSYIPKE